MNESQGEELGIKKFNALDFIKSEEQLNSFVKESILQDRLDPIDFDSDKPITACPFNPNGETGCEACQ